MKILSVVALVLALGGCSTIQTHSSGGEHVRPYGGTAKAMNEAKRAWHNYEYVGEFELRASDVAASAVVDTLLLPYDLYHSYRHREQTE